MNVSTNSSSSSSLEPFGHKPLDKVKNNSLSISTKESIVDSGKQIEAVRMKSLCGHCQIESSTLLRCGKCKKVHYCSKTCQIAAWKTHQTICINDFLIPKDDELVCKLQDANGVKSISQKEYKKSIKSTFVKAPLYSKSVLEMALKVIDQSTAVSVSKKPEVIDSVALFYQGAAMGYGVVALKDIQKRDVICNFGGEVISNDEWNKVRHSDRSKSYSVIGENFYFDPSIYSSLGAVVNDGPPNAEIKTNDKLKIYPDNIQVPLEKVLVAVRDIKKGEIIYVDYGGDHSTKKGLYMLDEDTLNKLIQTYSNDLDISFLNKTGWVFSGMDKYGSYTSDLVKATEIEYIFSTPYVLALLHLRTSLNPAMTLKNFERLSRPPPKEFGSLLSTASSILEGLTKVNDLEKKAFSEIVGKISQDSFIILCKLLVDLPRQPSLEECEKFGKALDKLRLMFYGTLSGYYWEGSEREEFKQQFLTEEYQKKLYDETEIDDLPSTLRTCYYDIRGEYSNMILKYLSKDDLILLQSLKRKIKIQV